MLIEQLSHSLLMENNLEIVTMQKKLCMKWDVVDQYMIENDSELHASPELYCQNKILATVLDM